MSNDSFRTSNLVSRLRARLVVVPKPGTKPRNLYPHETITLWLGGDPRAGDDAGLRSVGNGVQEHVYAVDPLCDEAAQALERTAHETTQPLGDELQRVYGLVDHWYEESKRLQHAFKNFHRALCERFDYGHDEKDWQRDQVSLIEWIAKRPAVETAAHDRRVDGWCHTCSSYTCSVQNGEAKP